jgi:peptidoglycan/LPS O-acetylase OafA/YrhL
MSFALLSSLSPTPFLDFVTLASFVLYISLAATVTSLPVLNNTAVKAHRVYARLSAFVFSILLGIWGSRRWGNANTSTAIAAIIISSSFLIAGTIAEIYADPTKDGTLERFAATTSALYPALVGLLGGGLLKLITLYSN